MTEQDRAEDLVNRVRQGDQQAFRELFDRFRPRLERQVRGRMGAAVRGATEVDDIVQETFLKAAENSARLEWRGEERFASWLGCIAERLIWKVAQTARRRPLQLDREVAQVGTSPSRALGREERRERLERALAHLSPDHRQVVTLARIERLRVREIAARMDRSENAVKKLLARALVELKHQFGDTTGSLRLPDATLGREEADDGD